MALLAVAQWEWQAQDENQLDVAEGSTVELLNAEDSEWWQVRLPAEPTQRARDRLQEGATLMEAT